MKYGLPIIIATIISLSCNSAKEKEVKTVDVPVTDTATSNDTTAIMDQQPVTIADTTPVPANRLIIPAKSIGLTSIGQKNEEARKHLGPPAVEDAGMGKEFAAWYSKPVIHGTDTVVNEMNIFFMTNMGAEDEASRVEHIRVTSGFFMTADHIGTGSTHEAVMKTFPNIKKVGTYTSPKTKSTVAVYDDLKSGIAFEIDNKHICVGIAVHKSNEERHEIYNALFSDANFD